MELSKKQHDDLVEWIKAGFIKSNKFDDIKDSYNIQRMFEISSNGFYVDNETIKVAMIECGFDVEDRSEKNWVFNFSPDSPAIKEYNAKIYPHMERE